MPCLTQPDLTPTQAEKMRAAIARLEAAIGRGSVNVAIGREGGIAFAGWTDREGVSDICAYRALSAANSPILRRAIARAEGMQGRRLDPRAIAAGTHSHDGGKTWSRH